jgi:hypothetical protein
MVLIAVLIGLDRATMLPWWGKVFISGTKQGSFSFHYLLYGTPSQIQSSIVDGTTIEPLHQSLSVPDTLYTVFYTVICVCLF